MKYLLLAFLSSCFVVGYTPADIIGGHPYCEPVHENVWMCRDDYTRLWKCVNEHGRWQCWRVLDHR